MSKYPSHALVFRDPRTDMRLTIRFGLNDLGWPLWLGIPEDMELVPPQGPKQIRESQGVAWLSSYY